jgi:hypothetical protein
MNQDKINEFSTLYQHQCLLDGSTCPTTCEYKKGLNQLPKNKEGNVIKCGTNNYS